MHVDYKSNPIEVAIDGLIGSKNITIYLESKKSHGINSTFVFYTDKHFV